MPAAIGDYLILDSVRESGGTCIAVSDDEILEGVSELASKEGIYASPEVGAVVMAAKNLRASGFLKQEDETILFATGAGIKHTELVDFDLAVLDPNDPNVLDAIDHAYA